MLIYDQLIPSKDPLGGGGGGGRSAQYFSISFKFSALDEVEDESKSISISTDSLTSAGWCI